MKSYAPEKLVAISRYKEFFPTLPEDIQRDVYQRMRILLPEEQQYCDKGNYKHIAQILTSIALYRSLQAFLVPARHEENPSLWIPPWFRCRVEIRVASG